MILVTGAAQNLGATTARVLAQRGHDLILHYRNSRQLAEEVAASCSNVHVELIEGDFDTLEGVQAFLESYHSHFLKPKGLVNNVGAYSTTTPLETTPTDWLRLFQSNFHTPLFLIQSLLPQTIVNVGTSGLLKPSTTAYHLTKAALLDLTRTLAKELAPSNTTVNMVSPGYLETSQDLPETLPMGRPAHLEEAATVIADLFETPYITGQNIEVAGGIGL